MFKLEPWQMTPQEWDEAFEEDKPSICGAHRVTAAGRCKGGANSKAASNRLKHIEWLKMGLKDTIMYPGTEDEYRVPARHRDVIEHALRLGLPVPDRALEPYGLKR